jgi:EipB-like
MRASRLRLATLTVLTTVSGLCLGGSMAWSGGVASAGAPIRLQPHRATYDITLDETGPATSIGGITGRVVYELMGSACEGYAQNMRFVTEMTNTDGQSSTTDLRTSSWEDVPARRMRFSSSTYGNDQLVEQTQGSATKSQDNGGPAASESKAAQTAQTAGQAQLPGQFQQSGQAGSALGSLVIDVTKPERKSTRIAEPVFFPIDHSAAIIRHAREGRRMFTGNLYDGSEGGEKYYFTAAAIGPAIAPDELRRVAEASGLPKLAGVSSWPVAIAYFKPESRHLDQMPLYEMFFRFHDNGITSNLVIDHGDYRLKGELKELTLLDQSPCP